MSEHPAASIVTTPIRVTDLDFQRHMGNTAFTDLFANARFSFLTDAVWPFLDREVHVLALVHLEVDFIGQVYHPATVQTSTHISRVGRTSLHLEQDMTSDGRVVARSTSVLVLTERDSGFAVPLPARVSVGTTSSTDSPSGAGGTLHPSRPRLDEWAEAAPHEGQVHP